MEYPAQTEDKVVEIVVVVGFVFVLVGFLLLQMLLLLFLLL
jgi:hypothetical protein